MRTSESITNILKAIIAVRAEIGAVPKGGVVKLKTSSYGYARLEDYLNIVDPILSKNKLVIMSFVQDVTPVPEMNLLLVRNTLRLMHESGEWIEVDSAGADGGDKAIYKSITGARKYGVAGLFNMLTTDDPEASDRKRLGGDGPQGVNEKLGLKNKTNGGLVNTEAARNKIFGAWIDRGLPRHSMGTRISQFLGEHKAPDFDHAPIALRQKLLDAISGGQFDETPGPRNNGPVEIYDDLPY